MALGQRLGMDYTLAEAMEAADLSDRELATALGVDRSCIWKIRTGARIPSGPTLKKVERWFDSIRGESVPNVGTLVWWWEYR